MSKDNPFSEEGAEIIDFAPFLKVDVDPKMRTAPKLIGGCFSACAFVVSEHERAVTCSKCGRVWDAFDALLHMTRSWDRYAENRSHLRQDVAKLKELADRLRKDVTNLKAAKRRADTTTAEVVSALDARLKQVRRDARDEMARGFRMGLQDAIDLVKSDGWRKEVTP